MPWNEGLEGQSLEIAASPESPLRVVAGPGTGKTFALLRRLARLLEQGQAPQRVLLVTFTRVAADDLQRELNRLGLPQGEHVTKGTLHSLCFSILNRRHVLAITQRVPRPLLRFEERYMLEDLASYGDFGTIHQRRRTLKLFEAAWARTQDQQPGWPNTPTEQAFQAQLDEWLRFHGGMLLDELVPVTLRYLRANPACPERAAFDHVLVDEYQDLNRAEQELIDLLSGRATLTVVGDQDQAIYERFRYAHPEGIAQFGQAHPGTHDVPLDTSRRCPRAIVLLANALIRNNQRRSNRQLVPADDPADVTVEVVQWPTIQAEAEGIADYISARVLAGEYDPGRVLVLAPRRHIGYLIKRELTARNVDAHSFFHEEALEGDPKRLDDSRAQQAYTLLTLLVTPDDMVALRAWLGFGSKDLAAREYRRLRDYCAQTGAAPMDTLQALADGQAPLRYVSHVTARYNLLLRNIHMLAPLPAHQAFDALFPGDEAWAEPFRAIYDQAGEELDLPGILDLLRTNITQPELPTSATYVRIMSLHKSKGLTADRVFLPGCVEGLIPSYVRDLPFEEEMRHREEQRRLFYVAITRARRTLVLSSALTMPRDMAHRNSVPVIGGDAALGQTIASTMLGELGETSPEAIEGREWLLRR